MNSILNHANRNDYFDYLDSLWRNSTDSDALRDEFYACHRLKKAITLRLNQICRDIYNGFRPLLVDYDHEDIKNYRHYLIRVLLKFDMFLKRQRQYMTKLRNLYDPRPMRSIKPPKVFDAIDVMRVYEELINEMKRLEEIVSTFEEIKNASMSSAYETSVLVFDPKKDIDNFHEVKLDDNDDHFKNELESTYNNLVWIIESKMHCDISVFENKRRPK